MNRDLQKLARREYDVVIAGAGIYGAWAAWDAALRGLSVAVLEQGDFGGATSSNSLKIIHGGLRYLQHADFRRMRESIRERSILLRIAPHLVHPLPCLMPTYGHGIKGREAMAVALRLNDLISFDRNLSPDPQKHLPKGETIGKSRVLELLPGIEQDRLSGAALWYDCQIYNSERLLLSLLSGAVHRGAEIANYARVAGFLRDGNRVSGVLVHDLESTKTAEVRGKVVLNTAGPWAGSLLAGLDCKSTAGQFVFSKAFNLVVRRKLTETYAVGIPSRRQFADSDALVSTGSRTLFYAPWREYTLIGTDHLPYAGAPGDFQITEAEIDDFLDEFNTAYPALNVKRSEICHVYSGLLPADPQTSRNGHVNIAKQYLMLDHARQDKIEGLISTLGVKYTTARDVASKAVDLVVQKLGRGRMPSRTDRQPVPGGDIRRFEAYVMEEIEKRPWGLEPGQIRRLIQNYGSRYTDVLHYLDENNQWREPIDDSSDVLAVEVVAAIRDDMARKLVDVVRRRTELGSAGYPGTVALQNTAKLMRQLCNWSAERMESEIEDVRASYPLT